jgi:hypothetical protein
MKNTTPLRCTADVATRICNAIRDGLAPADAARAVGVPVHIFWGWVRRGETERDRLYDDPKAKRDRAETPYLQLMTDVEQAQSIVHQTLASRVLASATNTTVVTETKTTTYADGSTSTVETQRHIPPSTADAKWFLERRFHGTWAVPQRQVQVQQTVGDATVTITDLITRPMTELSDAELEQLKQELLRNSGT